MKAKLVDSIPRGDWIYEIKFDGYRALALRGGNETRILSRNQKDLGKKFTKITDSIAALDVQDVPITAFSLKLPGRVFPPEATFSGRMGYFEPRNACGGERLKTNIEEIRDPIHNFIHADRDEIMLINSAPFQRLRNIHQLSMTYMVYPAATHKRFEHSLGVMELAGSAFDAITAVDNVDEQTRGLFPEITSVQFIVYWRKVLRIAASLLSSLGPTAVTACGDCAAYGFCQKRGVRINAPSEPPPTI
jgi:ATP dependent DNA ligase domain